MRRKNTVDIKRRATLWAIYETTPEGLELVRQEVIISGKPKCEGKQIAAPITKGHVVSSMSYDDFIKKAKSEFIKEETSNAD